MAKIKVDYPLKKSKSLDKALEPGNKAGFVTVMSPKDFLKHAKRLKETKEDKLLISSFKEGMEDGKKFKALKLLDNNLADGRHRAAAAEELGIKKIPVIDYRESDLDKEPDGIHAVSKKSNRVGKATGGAMNLPLGSDDPNDAFRRLITWSFATAPLFHRAEGGRLGVDDGGDVNSIDAAIRAANEASARQGMTHEKGFSGNVEFAPVSIEEPLTHARLPLGSYPKATSDVVQPALQAVSEMAPYFTPAAPIAAARDVAVGMREGDPASVAMSALGLPGRAAKAAAVGASALMPEEAKAMFLGPKALRADRAALDLAKKLYAKGAEMVGKEGITAKTGWHAASEDMPQLGLEVAEPQSWWHEISDKPASSEVHSYLEDKYGGKYADLDAEDARAMRLEKEKGWSAPLDQLLNHPELFENYPHLKNMPVNVEPIKDIKPGYGGFYSSKNQSITLPAHVAYGDPEEAKSTLLHEIMHAIQHHEGAESGYNPNLGGVSNPEYARWFRATQSDPDMKEFYALKNSPEHMQAIIDSNQFYINNFRPRMNELMEELKTLDRGTKEYKDIRNKIHSLVDESTAAHYENYPIIKRVEDMDKALRARGIPTSEPRERFLTPEEAYWRSRGEVQARTVEARKKLDQKALQRVHPEETMESMERGYPYSKQVFRRANEGYDADIIQHALDIANRKE